MRVVKSFEEKKWESRNKLIDVLVGYLCENHEYFTDQEVGRFVDFMTELTMPEIFWKSPRLDKIIKDRVKIYCAQHKMKIEDYKGPLPYRMYLIKLGETA